MQANKEVFHAARVADFVCCPSLITFVSPCHGGSSGATDRGHLSNIYQQVRLRG